MTTPAENVSIAYQLRTAVFWDIENCHAPKGMSGCLVIRRIREAIRSHGSITCFKAYYDSQNNSVNPILRSQLQSNGVSLTDVPHNNRKDAADKMILVDMLAFAIDNPAPATIVLISGDSDFVYALSVLANRNYKVVLITYNTRLQTQASVMMDWRLDVLKHEIVEETASLKSSKEVPLSRIDGSLFWPLIETLEELQIGNAKPLRSTVGLKLISRWPNVYDRLPNITCFKEYAEAASKHGYVVLGGTSGHAWITVVSKPSGIVEE